MNEPSILNTLRLPGRLDVGDTARLLGCQPHDIAVLVRARLLKPLGNPAPNAPKYFATCEILEKAAAVQWLARASNAIAEHWRQKNRKRQTSVALRP